MDTVYDINLTDRLEAILSDIYQCLYQRVALATAVIMSPPLTEVGTCCFTLVRSVHCLFYLISIFYRAGGQTRDIDSILGYDANPTLAQY